MSKNSDPDSDTDEEKEFSEYYFESDAMVLRNNPDYRKVLRSLAILEAQRIQAVKGIDTLVSRREEALNNPIEFVSKLQQGQDLGIPHRFQIETLPDIDLEKYKESVESLSCRHQSRQGRYSNGLSSRVASSSSSSVMIKQELPGVVVEELKPLGPSMQVDGLTVRGRVFTQGKPETFNRLWTAEEQLKLQNLLEVYPSEAVESRRWAKIAKALGNRTRQQVASRAQKYFIKLARANLPIPGRMPNKRIVGGGGSGAGASIAIRKSLQHQRFRRQLLQQNSTFFAAGPVRMSDEDGDGETGEESSSSAIGDSRHVSDDDEDFVLEDVESSEKYRELIYLKQLLKKRNKLAGSSDKKQCTNRPNQESTSTAVAGPSYMDQDYIDFGQKLSYLDPNFMPL